MSLFLTLACADPNSEERSSRSGAADTARPSAEAESALESQEPPSSEATPLSAVDLEAEFEAIAQSLEQGSNAFLSRNAVDRLEAKLRKPNLKDERRATLYSRWVRAHLAQGNLEPAQSAATQALEWIQQEFLTRSAYRPKALRDLALVHLRRAEVENCLARPTPSCCVFPLAGDGLHTEREPAQAALDVYLELLAERPEDLAGRWLANVAAMALGEHPAALPEAQRIEPERFASEAPFPRFENIAHRLGIDDLNLCGGAAVADYDGDGHLDIVTSSYDPRASLLYYRGGPGLEFHDATVKSGLAPQRGGLNVLSADYDNDGDPDLLVLRGAWLFDEGQIRNSLLRNDGGRFTDVTAEAGLTTQAPTQAACFADFNGDGLLDLFIANESRLEIGPPVGDFPSELWINLGEGRFENRAKEAGVENDRYAKGTTAGDYDGDGDMDLYVSNLGPNRLYQNDGTGRFRDVARDLGVDGPTGRSFAAWFFDYDQDGSLDLFVTAFEARLEDMVLHALGEPHQGRAPALYRREGEGFRDVAAQVGLDLPALPMGAGFGDLDNDGFQEIFLATGEPSYEMLVPNRVLRNDAGTRFLDVTTAGGFGHLQKGHGVAFADFDRDGDLDVFNQLGGFYPADGFRNAFFENPSEPGSHLVVEVVGKTVNRDGRGAVLELVLEDSEGERVSRFRFVGSDSSFGGAPLEQHFAWPADLKPVQLKVRWPAPSRQDQSFDWSDATRLRVTEGRALPERLDS